MPPNGMNKVRFRARQGMRSARRFAAPFLGKALATPGARSLRRRVAAAADAVRPAVRASHRLLAPEHGLLMRLSWYRSWHLQPYHRRVHYSALAASLAVAVVAVTSSLSFVQTTHAASLVPFVDGTGATVVDTGNKVYLGSSAYGADVMIDNYSRQMSGYAWSADLGWIDFGDGGSNPVVADRAGRLSGAAKVEDTGGTIDFDAAPYGSDVAISGGALTGYAWSTDAGWVNFAGVSVPQYNPDLLPPDEPGLATAPGTSGSWYDSAAPSFTWNAPSDHAGGATTPSGVAGYLVYFGTDDTANITLSAGQVTVGAGNGGFSWQGGTTFTNAAALTTDTAYYLKVVAIDAAGNAAYSASPSAYDLFTYKYDSVAPTAPLYDSASPSGYSKVNSFTFSWPASGQDAAADTGGSGLAKYQYKVNGEASWHDVPGGAGAASVSLSGVAVSGVNTFDLQAVDAAGNASLPVRTDFYFNDSAPTAPKSLTATPPSSTTNSFAFSWAAPSGEIAGYYYSVNALPTASNVSYTTATSLPAGPYATQQGENTLYLVAVDSAGNYQFDSCKSITGNPVVDGCAKVTFSATTAAPGIPAAVQAYDISDRNAQDYAVAVKWVAPAVQGAGFAGYDVYRSLDGTTFAKVGSTTSTIYADGSLSSRAYYYYVVSKDNAGNYSASSGTVSITPTGRYTSPPKLVSGPTVTVAPTSLTVRWATDRAASSFVTIKDGNTFVSDQGQTDQTTDHEVKVVGLHSQSTYTYTVSSTDADGNTMTGYPETFTTANTPSVYDLNISNITQESAIINFKSTAVANFTLYYGTTANFGQTVSEVSSSSTTNHSLALASLAPGTQYFFRVDGYDADGNELRSENSFSTLPMPAVSHFAISQDADAATATLVVTWQTNVPTSSVVKYSADGTNFTEQAMSELVTDHSITLSGLADKTRYVVYAAGADQFGNVAQSARTPYSTPASTRPPKISNVVIESSNVGNGSGTTAQVAVAWDTDQPATSQVEYGTGLAGSDYTSKTVLDTAYVSHHLVIITGLTPGQPYQLRVDAADVSGNVGMGGDSTVITGSVSNSALQIILGSLRNVFGWMGNLKL